jgi:hypothetical protein
MVGHVNVNADSADFGASVAACNRGMLSMTASYTLTIKRLYGPGIILAAAKHNHRELAAEIGAASHIDVRRIRYNFSLRGPDTAAGVARLAKSLLDAAGVTDFRKTAVRALELLFMLPADTTVDPREYFESATCWAARHFNVPILSSIVHLDENAPHCHVLMLPLVNGKMNGSDLHGGKAKLWAMQSSFHEEVGVNYGFARQMPKKRLSAAARAAGIARLHEYFQLSGQLSDQVIDVLLKPHAKDPEALLVALGIKMRPPQAKGKSFVDIMTAPCKPEPRNHRIGKVSPTSERIVNLEAQLESYPYTCVGIGVSMQSDSVTKHRQNVRSTPRDSSYSASNPLTADGAQFFNRSNVGNGMSLIDAGNNSLIIVCGKLTSAHAPNIEATLACASDQPIDIGRTHTLIGTLPVTLKRGTQPAWYAVGYGHGQSTPASVKLSATKEINPSRLLPGIAAEGGGDGRCSTSLNGGKKPSCNAASRDAAGLAALQITHQADDLTSEKVHSHIALRSGNRLGPEPVDAAVAKLSGLLQVPSKVSGKRGHSASDAELESPVVAGALDARRAIKPLCWGRNDTEIWDWLPNFPTHTRAYAREQHRRVESQEPQLQLGYLTALWRFCSLFRHQQNCVWTPWQRPLLLQLVNKLVFVLNGTFLPCQGRKICTVKCTAAAT